MRLRIAIFGLALFVAAVVFRNERVRASGASSLTVVSYGSGAYQESHRKAFVEPFAAKAGVSGVSLSWGAEYGHLKEMVRSGRVPWDVVEVTAAQYARGLRENLFAPLSAPIPTTVFSPLLNSPPATNHGVPNVYWSTVLAYRASAFNKSAPGSWADFWDVRRYPGPRALYDNPRGALEFALLADGVSRERLYPLDVNRAFRKLNAIKPAIRLWWSDGTEPVNALLSGRVVLTSAWSGRIFASEQARSEIKYSWNGAAHELDYWVIPRGAVNPRLSTEFIRYASAPEPMAKQAAATAYGPANRLALRFVPAAVLPQLPTAEKNWAVSFVVNSGWWSQHEQEVQQRWAEWRSGK